MKIHTQMAAAILLVVGACTAPGNNAETARASDEPATAAKPAGPDIKLYTMSCGQIAISDLKDFSDDHAYDGKSATFADTCYLIRHPDGDLMWDAGIPDELAEKLDGMTSGEYHVTVPVTLKSQLAEIGVDPAKVKYFAMSHSHFDHTGNANYFAGAPTWLVEKREYDWMFGDGPKLGLTQLPSYEELKANPRKELDGDYDVFGDGSVQIISTPGHTPGHIALLVKLTHMGNVMLTGDLYHMKASRTHRRVPVFNTSKEETLQSMDKFEALAKKYNALVVIQHNEMDFKRMPVFPAYSD